MSVWTHVVGCIRIDSIRGLGGPTKEDIEKILGPIITYDHIGLFGTRQDECPKSDIPCGSEGSLEYQIWEDPDKCKLAAFVVAIWGDLRRYDNFNEIKRWFKRIVYDSDLMIRQAFLEAKCDNGERREFLYVPDKERLGE